jgi:hypothetical protein
MLSGQVGDLIMGNKLLVVPTGPLAVLPFRILATENPVAGLVLPAATPFTVLPSVSSLKALRQVAKANKATVRTSACVQVSRTPA